MNHTPGLAEVEKWFKNRGWQPFDYQREVWEAVLSGKNGLLNAPTGSGKTYALWIPLLINWMNEHPKTYKELADNGLQLLWITPLRALAKDLEQALQTVVDDLEIPWEVARRTGDVSAYQKKKMQEQMPEVLITTPESLHILLAQKGYPDYFENLQMVVMDEWHELLGSKRGTQAELGLSRLKHLREELQIWGISATIGNLEEALDVLLGTDRQSNSPVIIKADIEKKMEVQSVLPDDVEKFPWSGHLGTRLLPKVLPIINESQSTLIFCNTRSQSEVWFQQLLDAQPELAGSIALHHGSLDPKIRSWVEVSLHEGSLKAVVCTSSLDLGVDFTPVETVIQVGSPKGVARFLQRAGRSGHQPGATSRIYFVPTNALELIEAAALKTAAETKNALESRDPILKPYDVLVQYLVTLGVSDGFQPDLLFNELRTTFAYQALTEKEWNWLLNFLTTGGKSLTRYDKYSKLVAEDGVYRVTDRKIARRHRMSIGTIASDTMMKVKYMKGATLGNIEEWFITKLKPGDTFWFAGRALELIRTKDMTAYVRRSNASKAIVPSWMGGRMSLSSDMSKILRHKMHEAIEGDTDDIELQTIQPILDVQNNWSILPDENELVIEKTFSKEGCHLFFFPFEGRYVHEGMSALVAYRISQIMPITFSIAMNDYGFELLSDKEIPIEQALEQDLFSDENLVEDIFSSLNDTEMARHRFRGICQISGLIFPGYPGQKKTGRHLQMSSGLFFDVFSEYEPDNLLLQQAYDEVLSYQLDEVRLRKALKRIQSQKITLKNTKKFTPFAFPIMVDRLRERLTSEKLIDQVKKMQVELEKQVAI
ncbi:ligase-associated DNA damage response DEXH box helicase [Aliifodinibius sp. S!AR15-10]|uniref:ligase-associated DNA damage response DEXH box helicase n=1 Tax=Aliifodinibius sp. S!AR15-10 TaxID=2950437 RepID=UPI0028548B49|nr:ligase-associated DNA damage response DEXH box helicase [Aliifodinibius sp. S!AR15-10]MDR8392114.1 ligase-associated DNA damage response DEXH box helicase [Aliifodinibius sp. S!AR15-10]